MDFGEEPVGGSDRQKRKSRYHRHTPRQIQQLESYIYLYIYIVVITFQFCPLFHFFFQKACPFWFRFPFFFLVLSLF
jgi:hypothetical protein